MHRPALLAAVLVLAACATPVAPSGGPPDRTPPALVGTLPADGATRVTGRTLSLAFSERLDAAGAQAVTVTPQGESPPEVRVRGSEIEVVLPELREATTYVVTIGTELKDQRGVALTSPITVAFATGDEIDRGRLDGVVRDPVTGGGVGSLAVWAYALADTTALPDVRAVAPDYQTGTGTDGAFRLEYLRPGPYFVVAVEDRNRNRRVDDGERFAAPPRLLTARPAPATTAAPDSTAPMQTVPVPERPASASAEIPDFWITTLDSIAPSPSRVRSFSDRRFAVRFDEPVQLSSPSSTPWTVVDSVSGQPAEVEAVYQTSDVPFEIVLQTSAPLAARSVVSYAGPGGEASSATGPGRAVLADSAGNAVRPFTLSFTPGGQADTLQSRLIRFLPAATVSPDSVQTLGRGERAGVLFSAPPDDGAVVVEAGGTTRPAPVETVDRLRVFVVPDSVAAAFTLRAGDQSRRYARLGTDATGAVVGRVEGAPAGGVVYVEVRSATGPAVLVEAEPDGQFAIDRLAPGPVALRVWADQNGNGRWDGGSLVPYRPPEPLRILPNAASVRARWETEVPPIVLAAPPRP